MVKIAILSFFSGIHERGVETWAKNLKSRLSSEFKIDIIGGKKGESVALNVIKNIGRWSKADIIIPTNGRLQVLICRLVTWLLGKPIIVLGHSGPGADDKWNLLCSPNIFVAFSDSQKKWAEAHKLSWTKIVKIPHAVDTSFFKPLSKKPRKKIVLCVAANQPDKRIGLVRKAVEQLEGFEFISVGKGNEKKAAFTQMPKIYQSADVFCFTPQTWEAFGLVFLESMASNLPIVTIDDSTRREIVGEAGIFVKNPEDSGLLAEAIKEAYDRDWGDRPRKQAEKFSWDKIAKRYEELFRK